MKPFFVCFFSLTWFFQISIAQVENKQSYTDLFFSIGSLNSDYSNIRNIYNDILEYYRYYGISIPKQTDFGKPLIVNAVIIFPSSIKSIQVGLGFDYCFSAAYSGYRDFSGSLQVNGSIKTYQIFLIIQFNILQTDFFSTFIRLKPGYVKSSVVITENLIYPEMPQMNYNSQTLISGSSMCWESSIGLTIPVDFFLFSFDIGYQYAGVRNSEMSILSKNPVNRNKNLIDGIIQSGFVYFFSIGLGL